MLAGEITCYLICRLHFGKLGRMIEAHPRLKEQSQFLFVPGPNDAGMLTYYLIIIACTLKEFNLFRIYLLLIISGPSTALPRCALPKYLTEEFQKHVPNAIFSSNPCRLIFLISDY